MAWLILKNSFFYLFQVLAEKARTSLDERPPSSRACSRNERPDSKASVVSTSEGGFDEHYEPLQSIGKGAFGFVKLARRKIDNEQVCRCQFVYYK